MAAIPTPANKVCLLAKKKESSNLYSAHTALALYTMISPTASSVNVTINKIKSGVVLLVGTTHTSGNKIWAMPSF